VAIPGSSWLARKAPGTVTRISSAWVRHAQTVCPLVSASFTSPWLGQAIWFMAVTWQVAVVPPRARDQGCGLFQQGEVRRGLLAGWCARRRRPLFLSQQHGVAVGIEHLGLAAQGVRGAAHPGDRHTGRGEGAEDGVKVFEEEVEQQRQARDVQRRPCRGQQDTVRPRCNADHAGVAAFPAECS
jgi:hypothetical protein